MPISYIISNGDRLEDFHLRCGKSPISSLPFIIKFVILAKAIRQQKETKASKWKRKVKNISAIDDMILYVENPNDIISQTHTHTHNKTRARIKK